MLLLWLVRNNLLHGGKHGDTYRDNPERTMQLLQQGRIVLDELVELDNFGNDYRRNY